MKMSSLEMPLRFPWESPLLPLTGLSSVLCGEALNNLPTTMSAQAQMRALLDQLMGTARDGSVYLCQPTSICKGVAEKPHVHRAVSHMIFKAVMNNSNPNNCLLSGSCCTFFLASQQGY
ncbi:unnamed protein product [Oncorhynchus mykiss]|uniref:Uncharacterized protein n=1 Tax=Oncorhynchus mykiss TaxID=8022 RepID=A0A060X164_ONCMY|nr:unnamed protein product [Oncorhynchus mykiss]